MPAPRIKVCCIASSDEARLALACGADALGLVSAMPSGPGVIADEAIAAVVAAVPREVPTFLLTALADAAALIEQARRLRPHTLQLVDRVAPEVLVEVRAALPDVALVGVVHVVGPASVEEAEGLAPFVDALLLDSGNPALAVKELGGTGRVHDWALSRAIRERAGRPVWLAGGLRPSNAAEAVRAVGPHGLDVCTGVRTDGRLDGAKLRAFVAAARGGAVAQETA